eukprot:3439033-Amphidinium_carterae.1
MATRFHKPWPVPPAHPKTFLHVIVTTTLFDTTTPPPHVRGSAEHCAGTSYSIYGSASSFLYTLESIRAARTHHCSIYASEGKVGLSDIFPFCLVCLFHNGPSGIPETAAELRGTSPLRLLGNWWPSRKISVPPWVRADCRDVVMSGQCLNVSML